MFHKCRGWEIERVIWGGSWGFYNNSPKIGAHTHTVCVCVFTVFASVNICVCHLSIVMGCVQQEVGVTQLLKLF